MRPNLAPILGIILTGIALPATAQDDPRIDEGIDLFAQKKYVEAGELFEQVEQDHPTNLVKLNAMAAWYKADRCEEAMGVRARVDMTQPLHPQDIEDLDRVNAYCKLKSARAFKDSKEWDKALGLLAGLETLDEKLAGEIVALRQEIEFEKQAEQEQADLDKPKEVEPPPEAAPVDRPKWALHTGVGLLGGGAVLGGWALVKHLAVDQPNKEAGYDEFARLWCDAPSFGDCSPAEAEQIRSGRDAEEFEAFENRVGVARTLNISLAVAGGALGAGGAALLVYYALSGGGEPAATVAPMIGPDTRGVVFSLQF